MRQPLIAAGAGGTNGEFFDLAPPLTDAAEDQGPAVNAHNPTFELTQTRFALDMAIRWRERMGLPPMEEWGEVLRSLAPPPLATIVLEGRNQTVYNRHQSCLPSVFAESATNCQVQQSTLVYRFIDA